MMMSIALRFIPILIEETDKIMKAQIARGADFESGNLIQKAKNMVPLLVPLFVSAFRRANDLATAMEARCYRGGENRTKMKPLIWPMELLYCILQPVWFLDGSCSKGKEHLVKQRLHCRTVRQLGRQECHETGKISCCI